MSAIRLLPSVVVVWCVLALPAGCLGAAPAAELWVGAATTDITPERPVAVQGQFELRISQKVETPLTATAVALESRGGDRATGQVVMISCDLAMVNPALQKLIRDRLREKVPDFDGRNLFLTGTHTHTAPVIDDFWYDIPKQGVMQPKEYAQFLADRLTTLAADAWKNRQPGGVSWVLGHAVVGHNRRAVYANGTAAMYGAVNRPDFQNYESGEDHDLNLLVFWDRQKRPIAVAINVACPSQEVESRSTINADFWHDVREQLAPRQKDLRVLAWPGAAGDQSPHPMYRKAAELRMQKLRGLTSTQEIGRRIAREVEDLLEVAKKDIRTEVPLAHRVQDLALPRRKITEEEMTKAKAEAEAAAKQPGPARHARRVWHQDVVDRYARQQQETTCNAEIHVLRIGDVAIATNPFELFLDYGMRIKGRSKAEQTFVVQLTTNWAGYLPTQKAAAGGGYSAVIQSCFVSPEGGQALVDRTVEMINSMW
jgi:hypothetical protein